MYELAEQLLVKSAKIIYMFIIFIFWILIELLSYRSKYVSLLVTCVLSFATAIVGQLAQFLMQ